MTIAKGRDWGALAPVPAGLVLIDGNAALRDHIVRARHARLALAPVGLVGGDLARTLGASGDAARFTSGAQVAHMRVDVVRVVADDDRESWFAAHCIARRSWWRGEIVAACNAEFVGMFDVAPRSHPGDGKIDLISASAALSMRQRLMARRRLLLGTHVPHPEISMKQQAAVSLTFARPMRVALDGTAWGRARRLELTVESEALLACV